MTRRCVEVGSGGMGEGDLGDKGMVQRKAGTVDWMKGGFLRRGLVVEGIGILISLRSSALVLRIFSVPI